MEERPASDEKSPKADPEDLRRATRLLEAVVEDRRLLAALSEDEAIRLKAAAGRLSRPDRLEQMKTSKRARTARKRRLVEVDRAARGESRIRKVRSESVFRAPGRVAGDERPPYRKLNMPRDCYVCHSSFDKLHFFYDSMCPECAEFNYDKRFQTASLEGWTALITGGRLKIGRQAALMMLRAGARVVVTTRFPHDAAVRYAGEDDYDAWSDRLHVHGLDLRHAPSVEIFARYLDATLGRLDIIINNAAQTVRRPPGFYAHLLDREAQAAVELGGKAAKLLEAREACRAALGGVPALPGAKDVSSGKGLLAWQAGLTGIGIRAAAHLSQIPYSYDDAALGADVFPAGRLDADLQQVDKRTHNTWRMALGEVPTPELVETMLINAVAPFILNGKLKPLMLRNPTGAQHIVNVSAMEGSFSRKTKTDKHPHTNMAKAALNMMTLTSAPDYFKDGIHMNAVDTGWVTDEDPMRDSLRKRDEHDFEPPLDIVDGAARVCDPFFHGRLTGEHLWGKFLKDYRPTGW
ncbi:MAG: SDR family oxidoreductase [Elusimicrobiota bacterium]